MKLRLESPAQISRNEIAASVIAFSVANAIVQLGTKQGTFAYNIRIYSNENTLLSRNEYVKL